MAGHNWGYGDASRQQAALLPSDMVKRPRVDLEMPSGRHMSSNYPHDDEGAGRVVRDTETVNALYECYLRNLPMASYGAETGRSTVGPDGLQEISDLRVLGLGCSNPAAQSWSMGAGGLPEVALPHDASGTLFVEGLPAYCTRREVSHIFRPFLGYKEVRIVNREARHPGGDPVVLCFVDFESPAHAATVRDALQGYQFDEHDRDSGHLRLQFARNPGPRPGVKNLGKH